MEKSLSFTVGIVGATGAAGQELLQLLHDRNFPFGTLRLFASAHDCSDGGLAVALAECCMMERERQNGASIDLEPWKSLPLAALLFGEAQNRVVVSTTDAAAVLAAAKRLGVPARVIGRVSSKSPNLTIRAGSILVTAPLTQLAAAWHDAIPAIMSRSVAAAAALITETLSQR